MSAADFTSCTHLTYSKYKIWLGHCLTLNFLKYLEVEGRNITKFYAQTTAKVLCKLFSQGMDGYHLKQLKTASIKYPSAVLSLSQTGCAF